MHPDNESRFDPNFAAQLLLEIAHEKSLDKLLHKRVERAMERPHIICVQVWLLEKGDLCATCPFLSQCPDQSHCLHLVAVKAKSILDPGEGLGQFQAANARVPLGVTPLGEAVARGQERVVKDLGKQPVSSAEPDWMRQEHIRAYSITPITYKGEALGAIASATHGSCSKASFLAICAAPLQEP